jgi:hypothetical protein
MDLEPPFVAGAFENAYDEATANIKARTWYVALKRRFRTVAAALRAAFRVDHTGATTAILHPKLHSFFLIQQIIWELRLLLFVENQ